VLQALEDLSANKSRSPLLHGKCQFAILGNPYISIYVFNYLRSRTVETAVTRKSPGNANPTWGMEILYGGVNFLVEGR